MQNATILKLIFSAGPLVQCVLLILAFFSVLCWAIIISKTMRLRKAQREDENFVEVFSRATSLGDLYNFSNTLSYSTMAVVFQEGYKEYEKLKKEIRPGSRLLKVWLDNVERALDKGLTIQLWDLESGLGWLATIGNASPFIGLFGTVWGIMRSFHDIGIRGSATLATVAPGISEALVATAMGLFAAIPAVIAFNWFTGRMGEVEGDLRCFKMDFLNLVERFLIKEVLTHQDQVSLRDKD